jgi:hypothetical protein
MSTIVTTEMYDVAAAIHLSDELPFTTNDQSPRPCSPPYAHTLASVTPPGSCVKSVRSDGLYRSDASRHRCRCSNVGTLGSHNRARRGIRFNQAGRIHGHTRSFSC